MKTIGGGKGFAKEGRRKLKKKEKFEERRR